MSDDKPAFTVDRYGGVYSMTREVVVWRWWQRPRWAWRAWRYR